VVAQLLRSDHRGHGTVGAVQLRIFTEPQQGSSYDVLLRIAQASERLGFDAFFTSDHYLKMGGVSGLPGPTDAWTTHAGLARDTERIRLGTLVTPASFRLPGPLAIAVAEVDHMSGGRVELGLGAGWYEAEHRAYGIPFPPLGERFDRLEEYVEVVTGIWSTPEGERFSFAGQHFQVQDSPGLPKPAQRSVPLIIGGSGPRRTPRLAARFAAEFNLGFAPLERFVEQRARVVRACEDVGRDPASMTFSVALVLCCGKDEAEFTRRAAAIGREPDELRQNGVAGLVAEVAERLHAWSEAGAERVYLQVLDLEDLDHLALVDSEVRPLLG
jgi:F420-dependent oxidoreductase-like protein